MADNNQSGSAQPPRQPATQEMLDATSRHLNEIRERNPQLADTITVLRNEHLEPLRANQSDFQHSVARTAEDVEKALGHQIPLSEGSPF